MPGEPSPTSAVSRSKMLQSSDGSKIYAEASGNPKRPHVILMHGFTLSAAVFDEFCRLPLLLEELYIVRYDMRGHGRSAKPDTQDGHLSRLYADDFMTVVRAFNLEYPIFVGWSIGGAIVADLCANVDPLPISGVLYLASVPHTSSLMSGSATQYLLSLIASCDDHSTTSSALLRLVDGCFASPHAPPPTFQTHCLFAGMQTLQSKAIRDAASRRTQETHTLWEKMEEGLPVCAMHGTDDMLVDGNFLERELRKHAKNLDIKIVDGAGHALFWEMPDETAEVVVQFAKKVWKRPQ
ncbi:Esterase/lipase/thioesterase [Heterobasidion irregulare TC 32-1]|uniref:Esterase/lipase/thioesterase n=1 Tax=Heterobasidion irregulare (strain TC 32-1) TaxID=747525 RepID=W4JQL7_HETIT|nr:Esterase/lipase/thioesterase [Heterobasidion irregulare TC 32-1]ETW75852.1 Esterase/lipase/thioesterase [Heterobasidion irregulare TC 32-1]